jgi:signal transduction histidine kinase
VSRPWPFISKRGLDLLIVVAAAFSAAGTASRHDAYLLNSAVGHWFEVFAVAAVVLVLLWRRRAPFAAPTAMWMVSALLSFVDGLLIPTQAGVFLAGLGGAFLLGNARDLMRARLGLAVVLGGAVIIVYNDPRQALGEFIFTPTFFVLGWLVGYALRERAEQAEAAEARAARAEGEREAMARVAVAEERARIARELHDIVAHAVSVMVLQVGAVRHRMLADDDEGRDVLKSVEQVGRTALAQMRQLLDAMRDDGDQPEFVPHPGLDNLDGLLSDVRAAGLDVQLEVHGTPCQLPPGLDLSAYRILQEGLTNVLKHARARRAEVALRYGAAELQVEVRDDGQGNAPVHDRLGHGLVGIGERVKIFGGEMSTDVSAAGGFVLRARLPLEPST